MRSGTSFFDLTIYRKTVNRFWPLWVTNLVIWLFVLPFNGLIRLGDYIDGGRTGNSMLRFARSVGGDATEWGVIFAVIGGLVVAMAVCSHLYNNRSANFMGSLPCRREGQFLSVYAAGLTILLAPNVIVFLLTLLVEAAAGVVVWVSLLYWLAALSAMEFFFFTFAVCLGQFTGHILALPVFYGVFNAIVLAVFGLFQWVLRIYYFGYDGMNGVVDEIVYWCTPVIKFAQMDIRFVEDGFGAMVAKVECLWIAAVYAGVAVVLAVCAMLLYRRRHMETSGDIVAVRPMRPVFKYGVAICVGLFFGFLMDQMFSLGEIGMMVSVLIWGVIGYFVAQMLLDKTVRVFKKWKGAAGVVAAFLILFAVIGFDLTGYETRVPAPSNVEQVYISGLLGIHSQLDQNTDAGGNSLQRELLTDPADIEAVVALHKAITEVGDENGVAPDNQVAHISFQIEYVLKNGRTLRRDYLLWVDQPLLDQAQALRDRYNVRYQNCGFGRVSGWEADGYELSSVNLMDYGLLGIPMEDYSVGHDAYVQELWAAVQEDFEAGRIGTHTVIGNAYAIEVDGKDQPFLMLNFQWGKQITDGSTYVYLRFVVSQEATATLAVLEDWPYKTPEKTMEDLLAGA